MSGIAREPDPKPTLLLVDDHPNNLLSLEAVLGTSDYHLLTAKSGPEALAILEKENVALVLLDIQMPGMDGYEVLRRIKSSERTRHIPVILVTAIFTEDPHVRKGYEVGAVDYFTKPFNPDFLRLKVGIYTQLYTNSLALRRRELELRTILESIPDAVYVGDEKGVTRCNTAALALFGFSTQEELSEPFERLASKVDMRYADSGEPIPAADLPYSHALRGEQFLCELKVRHAATGEDLTIASAASPIILDGRIIGAVVVNLRVPDVPDPYFRQRLLHQAKRGAPATR